jgi:hypothetical protein
MKRNGWVVVSRGVPFIEVNLKTGQVADYGRVAVGAPEYLALGQLSEEARMQIRAAIDKATEK